MLALNSVKLVLTQQGQAELKLSFRKFLIYFSE